jgi:hypothetical protein
VDKSQAESLVVTSLAPAYQLRVVTLYAKRVAPPVGDTEVTRFVGECEVVRAQACTTCVSFTLVVMCTLAYTVIIELTTAHMAG